MFRRRLEEGERDESFSSVKPVFVCIVSYGRVFILRRASVKNWRDKWMPGATR